MSKVLEIKDKEKVRLIRDSAWQANATDWSKSRNLPIILKEYLYQKILENLKTKNGLLVDLGCGNAWLVDYLFENKNKNFNYLGLEINSNFVESNIEKYKHEKFINFRRTDLEKTNDFDFVFSSEPQYFIACLSFIEIIDLDKAFSNVVEMMNPNDKLSLVVLDPNFEIFRMSSNLKTLESNLLDFFNNRQSYYKKEIVLNENLEFKSQYVGLLHKMEDYILNASINGLSLISIDNINCYNKETKTGTIYRVLNFIRND